MTLPNSFSIQENPFFHTDIKDVTSSVMLIDVQIYLQYNSKFECQTNDI